MKSPWCPLENPRHCWLSPRSNRSKSTDRKLLPCQSHSAPEGPEFRLRRSCQPISWGSDNFWIGYWIYVNIYIYIYLYTYIIYDSICDDICIVLYRIVFCWIVLNCIVIVLYLYCICCICCVLHRIALYCIVLHCIAMYSIVCTWTTITNKTWEYYGYNRSLSFEDTFVTGETLLCL